ncbi:hypothetical protein [Owariibacterium komagatae]|uniref:hypothetical protein n=1 Tax=Owariibacterium komagatae TaxID=3136601 RepID=UPI0038B2BF76
MFEPYKKPRFFTWGTQPHNITTLLYSQNGACQPNGQGKSGGQKHKKAAAPFALPPVSLIQLSKPILRFFRVKKHLPFNHCGKGGSPFSLPVHGSYFPSKDLPVYSPEDLSLKRISFIQPQTKLDFCDLL